MFVPQNEQGVVIMFASLAKNAGWEFVEIGTACPDATIRRDEEIWTVEFEFLASSFLVHGHDHRLCDMIICWENDYFDCPLPVMALNDSGAVYAEYAKLDPREKEIEYWKRLAQRAENKIRALQQALGVEDTETILLNENETNAGVSDALELCRFYDKHGTVARGRVMGAGLMTRNRWDAAQKVILDSGVPINHGTIGTSTVVAVAKINEFVRRQSDARTVLR